MDPERITLKSNIGKIKWLRENKVNGKKISSSIIDKAAYLLPTLHLQPYINVTKEGNISFEFGREDGSFLNFYIYDEPKIHMVVSLKSQANPGGFSYVRKALDPNEVNRKIFDFYKEE